MKYECLSDLPADQRASFDRELAILANRIAATQQPSDRVEAMVWALADAYDLDRSVVWDAVADCVAVDLGVEP